jgi:hypothetical protein
VFGGLVKVLLPIGVLGSSKCVVFRNSVDIELCDELTIPKALQLRRAHLGECLWTGDFIVISCIAFVTSLSNFEAF